MKKEVVLAIAIGFALGLVITFGIWTANKSLKSLPSSTTGTPTPSSTSATPTTTSETGSISLSLSQPTDEALVSTNKVTLSGKTSAQATVAIMHENGQTIVSADSNGDFTFEVPLVAGYNVIRVTAFDNAGNMAEDSLTITYSTQV